MLHWCVKGLLSYVRAKGKAHLSKPTFVTFVSTTPVVQEVDALEEDGQTLRNAASGLGEG